MKCPTCGLDHNTHLCPDRIHRTALTCSVCKTEADPACPDPENPDLVMCEPCVEVAKLKARVEELENLRRIDRETWRLFEDNCYENLGSKREHGYDLRWRCTESKAERDAARAEVEEAKKWEESSKVNHANYLSAVEKADTRRLDLAEALALIDRVRSGEDPSQLRHDAKQLFAKRPAPSVEGGSHDS